MQQALTKLETILDAFYHWEKTTPDAPFLYQPLGGRQDILTWAEAGQQARKMAAYLRKTGLSPGDHVGMVSKNCCHWIIADLAIMLSGCVSVPFYPTLTPEQFQEVLALSDVKALFAGKLDDWESFRPGIPEDLPVIAFPDYPGNAKITGGVSWAEVMEKDLPFLPEYYPEPDTLWTILFTSGTTGTPKGVMLEYKGPAMLIQVEREYNNLALFGHQENRFFSYLPLNHIAERAIVECAAVYTGGAIYFVENMDTFVQNLQAARPNTFLAVPRIWSKFQQGILQKLPQKRLDLLLRIPLISTLIRKKIKKGLGLDQARILATGAAPMPDALKSWYLRLGMPILEVYGMTENCGACSLMPRNGIKSGVVGKPLQTAEVKIDADSGEILMTAPWVMRGYYNDEPKTRQVIRNGWLHTGDQGRLDDEGYLKITGRVSDTFKSSKGKFIVPGPMESGFARNDFIEQVCVVGMALPQPVALITLSESGKKAEQNSIKASLTHTLASINQGLAGFERIYTVVIVKDDWTIENGILTPTLKIKRNAVSNYYEPYLQDWIEKKESIVWE